MRREWKEKLLRPGDGNRGGEEQNVSKALRCEEAKGF